MAPVKTPLYNDVSGEKMTSFNIGRAIASFLVGIPTALATSVLVGTAYLMVEAANICHSSVIKDGFKKKLVQKPGFKAASDALEKAFFGVWTEFGIYGYLKVAEGFVQAANTYRVRRGEMEPPHDLLPGEMPHVNTDEMKIAKEIQNDISTFFKAENLDSNNIILPQNAIVNSSIGNALGATTALMSPPSPSPSMPGASQPAASAGMGGGGTSPGGTNQDDDKRRKRRTARRERNSSPSRT